MTTIEQFKGDIMLIFSFIVLVWVTNAHITCYDAKKTHHLSHTVQFSSSVFTLGFSSCLFKVSVKSWSCRGEWLTADFWLHIHKRNWLIKAMASAAWHQGYTLYFAQTILLIFAHTVVFIIILFNPPFFTYVYIVICVYLNM